MNVQILDRSKKKKIIDEISIFGIQKIQELLIKSGKNKIRAYRGILSNEELVGVFRKFNVESIGLYVAREDISVSGVRSVRLSVDALHLWKEMINKRIIVLNKEQENLWFKGENITLSEEQLKSISEHGFYVVKSFDGLDFIGMGKVGINNILYNYLPKERTRKTGVIS